MNFLKFDVGKLDTGRTVQVTLSGSVANVRLINNTNMYNYEHGREYSSIGGLVKKAMIDIPIPKYDHWFVVIDMKGIKGTDGKIDASVRVL